MVSNKKDKILVDDSFKSCFINDLSQYLHVKTDNEFFYISNLISISRFLLAAICAYLLISNDLIAAIIIIIIIWISDLLDGYFARSRNEISELGKIIDPLADKFAIFVIALIMVYKEFIPLWFFIVLIVRDIVILIGGLYLRFKTKVVLQSNLTGKVAAFIIGFTILMFLLKKIEYIAFSSYHNEFTELFLPLCVFVSLVVIVFSIISYLNRFLKLLKKSTN